MNDSIGKRLRTSFIAWLSVRFLYGLLKSIKINLKPFIRFKAMIEGLEIQLHEQVIALRSLTLC